MIEQGWLEFASRVLPKNPPPGMEGALKAAYYAGAQTTYQGFDTMADQPEEEGLAMLQTIQNELLKYQLECLNG